jgi:hypothetical protein
MFYQLSFAGNKPLLWVVGGGVVVGGVLLVAVGTGILTSSLPLTATQPTPTPTINVTVTPTASPAASPTDPPTTNPTASPTHTATPTTSPTASPSPSPSPTPTPDATTFQNVTLTYGEYVNQTLTWIVNGTLIDTVNSQGISGLTISVVDATNSSIVYGTVETGDGGYFEYTLASMAPPSVQLVFAGNNQYVAITSATVEYIPQA